VHRPHDVIAFRVLPVIRREIVALQGRVIAEEELVRFPILEPGIVERPAGQVPEMMVRVDDQYAFGSW
jgi:hypothetical protein